MADNQLKDKVFKTPSEVFGINMLPLLIGAIIFMFLLTCLINKAHPPTDLMAKSVSRQWFDDDKYLKPAVVDNTPHFVPDTLFSRGTLIIGDDKYQEVVTITKIK